MSQIEYRLIATAGVEAGTGVSGSSDGGVQLGQRAALYCRVSTNDQSRERRERDLAAFAERRGYRQAE